MPKIHENGDIKEVLLDWLVKQRDHHIQKKSQGSFLYSKAHHSVNIHPDPLLDPKSCKKLKNVGDKMIANFQKHLVKFCEENGYPLPDEWNPDLLVDVAPKRAKTADGNPVKRRKIAKYVPKRRSGGYAILLALYLVDKERSGLRKDEIIKVAAQFCDSSFTSNPGSNEFYSAWNSIKLLEKHDLVSYTGRRTLFYITDEGIEVAEKLAAIEDIPVVAANDYKTVNTSIDNGIRATPDNSLLSDSFENVKDPRDLLPPHLLLSPVANLIRSPQLFVPSSEPDFIVRPVTHSSPPRRKPMAPPASTVQHIDVQHDKNNKTVNGTKYSIWLRNEYEIVMVIDEREVKSKLDRDYFETRMTRLGIACEVRVLSVGDIAWIAKHKKSGNEVILNVICERKRLDDLALSIKDGRFVEQKHRLCKTNMKRYYYLVEETGIDVLNNFSQQLQTAQSMTMLLAKFRLKKFKNLDETTLFLASLTNIIDEDFSDRNVKLIVIKPRLIETLKEYSHLIDTFRQTFETSATKSNYECCHSYLNFKESLNKSQMYTVKEMFLSMLMSIKGVTIERALAIQNQFGTPKKFLTFFHHEMHDKPENIKQKALSQAFLSEIGGKKITNSLLQKIYEVWGV